MKKNRILLGVILFVISCSAGANKFIGKWKQLNENGNQVMIIEKKENSYDVYPEKATDLLLKFDYQKDQDRLTATNHGDVIEIKFHKDSNHIVMNMGSGETHEFEKVN